jgi:hypothetical protein
MDGRSIADDNDRSNGTAGSKYNWATNRPNKIPCALGGSLGRTVCERTMLALVWLLYKILFYLLWMSLGPALWRSVSCRHDFNKNVLLFWKKNHSWIIVFKIPKLLIIRNKKFGIFTNHFISVVGPWKASCLSPAQLKHISYSVTEPNTSPIPSPHP